MASIPPLSNGPSANVPSISNDTTTMSSFQHNLIEEMVEITKSVWNDCPETLARQVCASRLAYQILLGGEDPDTLRSWFEEWQIDEIFG